MPDEDARQPGDVLEFGGSGDGQPARRWRRLLPPALAVAVLVAIVVQVTRGHGTPASSTTTPPAAAPSAPANVDTARPTSSAPVVTQVGARLLGISADWELFGYGPNGVTRIEFARGRVTSTLVPPLNSGGPVSFAVGTDWAVIRPLDHVVGYVVRDGQVARDLTGALADGGPMYPGPDGRHLWVETDSGAEPDMALVGIDGRPTGESITMSSDLDRYPFADGTGYLIATGKSGSYLLRPDGRRRISTGMLAAIGPTRLLTQECDRQRRCTLAVVDRRTGARRALDIGRPDLSDESLNVISPDGGTAAILETEPTGTTSVHLIDLATGADRRINATSPPPFRLPVNWGGMVWSPDSRWLFIAGTDGALFPVDATTLQIGTIGMRLPPLTQLAVRTTGG